MRCTWWMVPVIIALGGATPGSCGGSAQDGGLAAAAGAAANASGTDALHPPTEFRARLVGFKETPAISTTGFGRFTAHLSDDGLSLAWTLQYDALQGNADGGAVTAAHVHLGQPGVAGGIAVPLCGAGGTPACPDPPASLTGTITSTDVTGPTAQGLAAGDLTALLRAMRAGVAYTNVHTTRFASGEIRGQVRAVRPFHLDLGGDDDD